MSTGSSEKKKKDTFPDLIRLMSELRSKRGCPWDREQTHKSLLPYLIEEAYEVLDTIEMGDDDRLKEELGDLLLQIIFHAQIAREGRKFDIYEVIEHLSDKLKARHPHVFGKKKAISSEEVLRNWEHIKLSTERSKNKSVEEGERSRTVLSGIPRHLPALLKAYRVQEKVARFDFDWKSAEEVFSKIEEEIGELKRASSKKRTKQTEIEEEMGDILFSWVNLCRHLNINPEFALRKTIDKFVKRFNYVERQLKRKKIPLKEAGLPLLDSLWEKAKRSADSS
ncbi:MAG: nucleoside triphosphate pyrophosphohydrolase [candidate division Zixibacteria bacterium]|nr:nucleoside triphosphate pyrophosphohydrolase [candidate division Zixibacteria bacterium]